MTPSLWSRPSKHHIEHGLSPRDAAFKAMDQVQGPVVAIALILSAVFIPTVFIPGITGAMYQQFAVTMAVSVIISAFNALTLSPALGALLLRPKTEGKGLLTRFYKGFNNLFGKATNGYVSVCGSLIRKLIISLVLIALIGLAGGGIGSKMPSGFIPEEDQGYLYGVVQLPRASSLQQTDTASRQIEDILLKTPGVEYVTSIVGFNLLSSVQSTYTGFFFITLEEWSKRKTPELQVDAIRERINRELHALPKPTASFAFPPPAIPGVGTAGGVTFILEDRTGADVEFIAKNTQEFILAAKKRPELASSFHNRALGRPAVLPQGRSSPGDDPRREPHRCLSNVANLSRRLFRQLFQPFRSAMAGVHSGGRGLSNGH